MEQRKVLLTSGPKALVPTSANVSLVVTCMAVEVTTVVTFTNILWPGFWNLSFPVNTGNGRLVQCAVVENALSGTPKVAFNNQTKTIAMGPCAPQFRTLVYTIVIVYVPSFRQSFISHLHMGSVMIPCITTVRIRNMLTGNIKAQIRENGGQVHSLVHPEDADSDWLTTTVSLQGLSNYKIHVFLNDALTFGVDKALWVGDGINHYIIAKRAKYLPNPQLWVLKPPAPETCYVSFYASPVPKFPDTIKPAEPQEILTVAAKIICNRDVFFDTVHCMSDSVISLDNIYNPCMTEWSWRDDVKTSPLIENMISFLELD